MINYFILSIISSEVYRTDFIYHHFIIFKFIIK